MTIIPESPAERRQRVRDERQQGSTFHQHAQSAADDDSGGRFAKREGARAQVVGATPVPKYPELPADSPFHHDPVPDEPPTGYCIDGTTAALHRRAHQRQRRGLKRRPNRLRIFGQTLIRPGRARSAW
jgi:hypothetical protein